MSLPITLVLVIGLTSHTGYVGFKGSRVLVEADTQPPVHGNKCRPLKHGPD